MKRVKSYILYSTCFCFCFICSNAKANDQKNEDRFLEISPAFELGYSNLESKNYLELGAGASLKIYKLRIRGLIGNEIYFRERAGFAKEYYSGGNEICRDLSNGQFSKEENCSKELKGKNYNKLEAAINVSKSLELGGGMLNFGDKNIPYGSVSFSDDNDKFRIYASGGAKYFSLTFKAGF